MTKVPNRGRKNICFGHWGLGYWNLFGNRDLVIGILPIGA